MTYLYRKLLFITIVIGLGLSTAACGSAAPEPQTVEGDIALEAQSVPSASTVTPTSPPPTELPTELNEPISPISPVSPVGTGENQGSEGSMEMNLGDVELPAGSEAPLQAAVENLIQQTGLSPDQIQLVSIEAQEWSDASLGCPQEGFMYAQVITPGYLIVLEAEGQQYEYHTDQGQNVILCEQ